MVGTAPRPARRRPPPHRIPARHRGPHRHPARTSRTDPADPSHRAGRRCGGCGPRSGTSRAAWPRCARHSAPGGSTSSPPDPSAVRGTVDEFLLRAPAALTSAALARTVADAGGSAHWMERADAHDLVDAPTRMLGLATRTALDAAELPLALRQLLGRCTIQSVPARSLSGQPLAEQGPRKACWRSTVMRLRDPSGGSLTVERPQLPFTPTEFARARALVELDARLGPRVPPRREVLTLPEGNEITVRRADTTDLAAAREMHDRCSPQTLGLRYHGPVGDADRYLGHLLSPRFGRTLAVETASGRLVALGHLLWDGDETEVALLVEDAWQRRGIGAELLRRLVGDGGRGGLRRACTRSPRPRTPAWSRRCAASGCRSTTRSRRARS